MRHRLLIAFLLVVGTVGAIVVGTSLARAGLVTDYVGVVPDYLLTGPTSTACAVPGNADREIIVTWQDRDDAEAGFIVTRQGPLINGTSTAQFQLPASANSGGTVSFTDRSVVPDADYTYTVRSFLGPALSPANSTSQGCSTKSVPLQPTNVVAVGSSQTTMAISWVDNSINEDGFYIYRYSPATPAGTIVGTASVDTTSFPDSELISRTEYCYSVVAYNRRGPVGIPLDAEVVCGHTESERPSVSNLRVSAGVRPTITWEFSDTDGPGGVPQQKAIDVHVCAVEFDDNGDCAGDNLRWSTSSLAFTDQSIQYLHGYPLLNTDFQHPLDFGERYYLRLRARDDTNTPSAWETATITVPSPSIGATIYDLTSLDDINIMSGASPSNGFGGEIILPNSGAMIIGDLSFSNVTSVRLLGSSAPDVKWEVKRGSDTEWYEVGIGGDSAKVWDTAADGLQWLATRIGPGQSVVGGVALAVNANHAPTVTQCRATPLIGGMGDEFNFTVSVTDPDSDFSYEMTQVEFDWDGGNGSAGWLDFENGYSTQFSVTWPEALGQGDFMPSVTARDQYGEVSATKACDKVTIGSATPAWLSTQDADVFSGGTVYSGSPEGQYNATYLVQSSGTIQAFTTAYPAVSGCTPGSGIDCSPVSSNYRSIPLPQLNEAGQPLGTVLGSVDIGKVDTNLGILGGRYGVVTRPIGSNINLNESFFDGLTTLTSGAKVLNGAIVHVQGNATVDEAVIIGNAGEGQSGAGLIVVDGDLFINAPIAYDVSPVQVSLRRLASIGWLVKGNVYIDPDVWAVKAADPGDSCVWVTADEFTDNCRPGVVGTFYLYDSGDQGNRGVFFTGASGDPNDQPLQLGGLVVAQRFALQRNRLNDQVPAELFRYDGRVFANPPPGLQDFAKALPRWRPLAPLP